MARRTTLRVGGAGPRRRDDSHGLVRAALVRADVARRALRPRHPALVFRVRAAPLRAGRVLCRTVPLERVRDGDDGAGVDVRRIDQWIDQTAIERQAELAVVLALDVVALRRELEPLHGRETSVRGERVLERCRAVVVDADPAAGLREFLAVPVLVLGGRHLEERYVAAVRRERASAISGRRAVLFIDAVHAEIV